MAQVRAEVQGQNAKELLDNLTEKCYDKCVTKPGTALSSSEEVGYSCLFFSTDCSHCSPIDLCHKMHGPVFPSM